MWKKKSPQPNFMDNCLKTIVTISQILNEGNYFEEMVTDEQKIKVSIEEETDTVLLEIKLREQIVPDFISNLKSNNLTKHLPVLMVTTLKTQLLWDQLNYTGNCFSDIKPGANPWLMVKINSAG